MGLGVTWSSNNSNGNVGGRNDQNSKLIEQNERIISLLGKINLQTVLGIGFGLECVHKIREGTCYRKIQ